MKKGFLIIQISASLLLMFLVLNGNIFSDKKLGVTDSQKDTSRKKYTTSDYFLKSTTPLIGYLINEKDTIVNWPYKSAKIVCDYTKIPFATIKLTDLNDEKYIIPTSLKAICIDDTKKISKKAIQKILKFVANGGNLIIPNFIEDRRFGYLIGLDKDESKYTYNTTAKGIKYQKNFIPNINNVISHKKNIHYGLDLKSFKKDIEVLAYAANEKKYPVIIQNKIGLGKVIFYNSGVVIAKHERGILFASLLSTLEGVPYPIASVAAFFLDDFPSPIYSFRKEPISTEYNITNQEFVNNIWWPDMVTLAKKHNIIYTATIIFNYEENTHPPFFFREWERTRHHNASVPHLITKDFLAKKHELGIHGYNHVSLLKRDWNPKNIDIALLSVKKKWVLNEYERLPASYIPPSNYIDKMGIESLSKFLPSIKYMCSSYEGTFTKGGDREYNPEPYSDYMFGMPRTTSGYYLKDPKRFIKESVYLFTGIWSHFVHPDDVYQFPNKDNDKVRGHFKYRNELSLNWRSKNSKGLKGMFQTMDSILATHRKNYPFTEFLDVRAGGTRVANIRNSNFEHYKDHDFYRVKNLNDNLEAQNWFVYISEKRAKEISKYLKKNKIPFTTLPFQKGTLFNVKTAKQSIKIPLAKVSKKTVDFQKISSEYQEDLTFRSTTSFSGTMVTEKIKALRKELLLSKTIDLEKWKLYAKYAGWLKREMQFWIDLENYYYINQNYETATLSKELAKLIWYITEGDNEKWLERQILTTNNPEIKLLLLKAYVKNFNTENNSKVITSKLKLIAELEPTVANKTAYISNLLWNNLPETLAVLEILEPSDDYKEIAESIAWFFYEKEQIQKAIAWAKLTDKITIDTKLYWLFNAKLYDELKEFYVQHIKEYPNDDLAKKTMSDIYLTRNKFKESWLIASAINNDYKDYDKARKELNKIFSYQGLSLRKDILINHGAYLLDKEKEQVLVTVESGDAINLHGFINTNKSNIDYFDRSITYSLVTKNLATHNISATSTLITSEFNHTEQTLYGLQYEFKNSKIGGSKINYAARLRGETNRNRYYYQLALKGNYNISNSFISLNYDLYPVKNEIAYRKDIYRNQLGIYVERNFKNKTNFRIYSEANYYTDHETDLTFGASANKPIYLFGNHQFGAALEASTSLGSADRVNGFPYFMIKNQSFGGGGVNYLFRNKDNSTNISLDGMYFADSHSGGFSRFRAQINLQFLKYYFLHLNGELFNNKLYHSNSLNIGVTYHIK
ncbi:conserved hypothetical protein [Tenacibaculum maritimum]|uniref:DUF2194 domain-containing protein n=1 Tax=Tenacibaculum maritimum TaxID=107401 RepID=UPI0012E6699C|nr:DUF2194 domain-containing protein [Tenacibaculum maritimum]CAA0188823.1 conserved hypothetical protein [Tenacibaculum maritimum]CAA0203332.1 conserved hypothetical protein [Tenacibaculum maritimum]